MLTVISPAKNLDYDTDVPVSKSTKVHLLNDAETLAEIMKKKAPQDISALMKISDKLGSLNYERYQNWSVPFNNDDTRQAIFAFKGDVYIGLDAYSMDKNDFDRKN